jgi:transcriptional regulator with XRE-family HTH domain
MNSFGEYLRNRREQLGLPLRKVAAELDIDTSILSKIERSERVATKEMLPTLVRTLETQEKEMEIKFIKAFILADLGELKFLKSGLEETLNSLKSRKSI